LRPGHAHVKQTAFFLLSAAVAKQTQGRSVFAPGKEDSGNSVLARMQGQSATSAEDAQNRFRAQSPFRTGRQRVGGKGNSECLQEFKRSQPVRVIRGVGDQRFEQIGDRRKLRLRGWLVAWGVGELPYGASDGQPTPPPALRAPRCSPRTIAGGFGNPPGFHIIDMAGSLARISALRARGKGVVASGDRGSRFGRALFNHVGLGRQRTSTAIW